MGEKYQKNHIFLHMNNLFLDNNKSNPITHSDINVYYFIIVQLFSFIHNIYVSGHDWYTIYSQRMMGISTSVQQ